jgi:hypothetical protein
MANATKATPGANELSSEPAGQALPATKSSRASGRVDDSHRVIYSFWIVGRNGGLLYSKDMEPSPAPIDFNDKLRLASSWFGMCGISAQLAPEQSKMNVIGGSHILRADTFDLYSFQTMTGTTFMVVTSPGHQDALKLLRGEIYRLYCDYVMKNPFHEAEQVIKSDLFDEKLVELLQDSRGGSFGE